MLCQIYTRLPRITPYLCALGCLWATTLQPAWRQQAAPKAPQTQEASRRPKATDGTPASKGNVMGYWLLDTFVLEMVPLLIVGLGLLFGKVFRLDEAINTYQMVHKKDPIKLLLLGLSVPLIFAVLALFYVFYALNGVSWLEKGFKFKLVDDSEYRMYKKRSRYLWVRFYYALGAMLTCTFACLTVFLITLTPKASASECFEVLVGACAVSTFLLGICSLMWLIIHFIWDSFRLVKKRPSHFRGTARERLSGTTWVEDGQEVQGA